MADRHVWLAGAALRRWRGAWARACLAGVLALMPCLAAAVAAPEARQGVLDLSTWPWAGAGAVELRGEWGFAWDRFIDPASQAPATAFTQAPGSWNEVRADGKPAGADGHASYSLTVLCAPGQKLALSAPGQRTAARFYVNGEPVATHGQPGATPEATTAMVLGRVPISAEYACPLRIVAHVANFEHRSGGLLRAPAVGLQAELASLREQRLAHDTALIGVFCVLGLLPVIFWAGRRKDAAPLVFGLFCLAHALYASLIGERAFLQLGYGQAGWAGYLRLEYLAWFAAIALFALMVRLLFPDDIRKGSVNALLACCAGMALVVLATPPRTFSWLAPVGQGLSVAAGVYVTWSLARAAHKGRPGASIFLAGMAFLVAVVLLDVLQYTEGPAARRLTPIGLLGFVLAPAVILARRLARALSAEELRALEQRLKGDLLVRTTQAGIYDWDATRDAVSYSPRLVEMLGHPPDTDTSRWPRLPMLVHPEDREREVNGYMGQLRRRDVVNGEVRHPRSEFRLLRADGSALWVMSEAIGLTGSDGRTLRYICSFIDITQRRALEERLTAQNTQLAADARLREDVERMSRHDLKTPLNSIIGVTRLLREDPRLTLEQQELLGITERAGYRMLELVNLSLDLFRMETGSYEFRPQAVDLGELLARVMVDMHGFAEGNKVGMRLARAIAGPAVVRAEELLCYSILANLLKNAVEATPPGGLVTVSVETAQAGPVRLRIHNPGLVPAAVAREFFGKYVSAGKSGGTGLGSYSARLMARVQEGELEMESSEGAGTTLTLALQSAAGRLARPRHLGAAPVAAPAAQEPGDFVPRRVLVVDDDEYNRLIVRRHLPSPPFTVETAVNGRAAIEAVAREWPDVVLIDMEMPVMNGPEAVAWIRRREAHERRPHCRIVMLSSNDDETSVARGLAAGSDRYLVKPVTREVLLATLRELGGPLAAPGAPSPSPMPASADDEVRVEADVAAHIPAFLASRRQLACDMAQALEAGEREKLRGLAHRAGGALALYGFQWAAAQSRRIELAAAGGAAHDLAADIAALQAHLDTVRVVDREAGGP